MRDISELKKNVDKYKDIKIQLGFKSKKNTVSYVILHGKPRVIKWYKSEYKENMINENSLLKLMGKSINVPKIIEKDLKNNVLIMNYIPGKNLCDLINNNTNIRMEKEKLMVLLAEWYYKFHEFFKNKCEYRIHGDSILRNFIFSDDIWGLDFEESRFGKPAEDIASMCSSILTTDPMFTNEKFHLCEIFLKTYYSKGRLFNDDLITEILYFIQQTMKRRNIQFSKNKSDELLKKI